MKRRAFLKSSLLTLTAVGLGVPSLLQAKSTKKGEKLKIAVLAASGKSGKLITSEALSRGHTVTAFVRDAKKMSEFKGLTVIAKDIFKLEAKDLQGYDAIIDAFGVWKDFDLFIKHIQHLEQILRSNTAKLLVVGGAGSLYVDKAMKTRLMDAPDFPAAYKPAASAQGEVLNFLRQQKTLNWVYVSPAAEFVFDAPKTNKYKIIGEIFETNSKGQSRVSYADYAAAMLDLAEDAKINKQRVGVIGL